MFSDKALVYTEIFAHTKAEITEARHALAQNYLMDDIKIIEEENPAHPALKKHVSSKHRHSAHKHPPHTLSIVLFVDQKDIRETNSWAHKMAHALHANDLPCQLSFPRETSPHYARLDLRSHLHRPR